ncbi:MULTISPECIES: hypothetical protein [unclassified Streptomyces]|uniref:hypothetical protein n=1 Tax=Streptomyces sp. NPDC055082 TaxID=3365718 RepID=UPI0037D10B2E
MEKYSGLDTLQQGISQTSLVEIVNTAARRSGLDQAVWSRQAQGDQEFIVLPADIPESTVLGDFIRQLTTALAEHNARRPRRSPLRIRVALDIGVARAAALGHSGQAPVFVARYLNDPQLKRVLAATASTNLVTIVSDRLYQDVVLLGGNDLDPEHYVKIHVEHDAFTGYGWIHVPEHTPAEIRGLPSGDSHHADTATERQPEESLMSTPDHLALLAATAVVGAMATDSWGYVRRQCAVLLGRHAPEQSQSALSQLNAYQAELMTECAAQRKALADEFSARTAAVLAPIASSSPDGAKGVRALAEAAGAAPVRTASHDNLTYRNIATGRDFIWSGRDTTVGGERP